MFVLPSNSEQSNGYSYCLHLGHNSYCSAATWVQSRTVYPFHIIRRLVSELLFPNTQKLQYLLPWRSSTQWANASSLSRIHDHTQTHHTRQDSSGRVISPTKRRLPDYTTLNKRQTSMPPVRFKPTIPASERPQTHTLDRAATGTGRNGITIIYISVNIKYKIYTSARARVPSCRHCSSKCKLHISSL